MTSTETRRPATVQPSSMEEAPVGTQLPHPTIGVSQPNGGPSGGDPSSLLTKEAAPTIAEPSAGAIVPPDHSFPEAHRRSVGRDTNSTTGHGAPDAQTAAAGRGLNSRPTKRDTVTSSPSSGGDSGHLAIEESAPTGEAPDAAGPDRTANSGPNPRANSLFDPALALAADILDDIEKVWVANANRLRILTRSDADSDGEYRGFGLDESHPDVARLAAMVDALKKLTEDATKHLEKVMRRHPLGPWQRDPARKGIGEKQLARLLAAIGDPYIRPEITRADGAVEPARPRRVSELRAYCGYHVLPAGHTPLDDQESNAGRGQAGVGDTDHDPCGAQASTVGVAPRRQRGQKSNWNETARTRAWLIAKSVVKAGGPYRQIYDATKAKYADAVHKTPCVRCGPKGKPAPAGSPLSKGHIDGRGLRAISRAVLEDLWIEARRLHEGGASL